MGTIQQGVVITPEEYLEGEKTGQMKHEYAGGAKCKPWLRLASRIIASRARCMRHSDIISVAALAMFTRWT
jgi:hypothetical protein